MKVRVGDKVRFVQSGTGKVFVGWVLTVGDDGAMIGGTITLSRGKADEIAYVVPFEDIKEVVK